MKWRLSDLAEQDGAQKRSRLASISYQSSLIAISWLMWLRLLNYWDE
ncbi:MAG: hypothetical protein AAFQ89_00755 [Cyanobacteria bacterium J06626_18]